ncbi:flagellar hook-length control protein [Mycobacterium sp. 21AC1]|uniref:flagellar hook-length control protein n=1 Tax=[Mycobacterium] appelbergii TaxID=2939269 RepID=UPI00293935A0|nr:flagellar hook-length control protein [Mycobacterium sp. 21AC1]MDV3124675.1 flagellar hook-length control protein [Mycobacterium sp. 21AC1]
MTETSTTDDVIKAAASIARDAAEGRLDPAHLDASLEAACRDLVGTVVGEGDPLWPLQVQIANGVLAAGGIEPNTLSEWAAVGRRRENPDAATDVQGGAEPAEVPDVLTDADSSALEPYSGENAAAPDDAAVQSTADTTVPEPDQHPYGRNRRILARGRSLPVDPGLRPL